MTNLVQAEIGGESLTDREIASFFVLRSSCFVLRASGRSRK